MQQDILNQEEGVNLKEELLKYLRYWPWFVGSVIVMLVLAFLYLRYTNEIYQSTAKIRIIDESKEMELPMDAMSLLGAQQINLDNEIEVVRSFRILEQVVEELDLDISYVIDGSIKDVEVFKTEVPFHIIKKEMESDSLNSGRYHINLKQDYFEIVDLNTEKLYKVDYVDSTNTTLPFYIKTNANVTSTKLDDKAYLVSVTSVKKAALKLQTDLEVAATNKNSEVLSLMLQGQSIKKTEAILNTLIDKFNQDGINDRQLVSKRTVDFVNERIVYLAEELDSVELGKQDYKQDSNISFLDADTQATLTKREEAEQEVINAKTQIALIEMLEDALTSQEEYSLLPPNIGIEDGAINTLVAQYNEVVLQRNAMLSDGAGNNNPTVLSITKQIDALRNNVYTTINVYKKQLNNSLKQLEGVLNQANSSFYQLPENEKMVREIERQQTIKETLYVLLLTKREEAAVNLAITSPSIKVVDYAITREDLPVAPKKKIIAAIALLLGLGIPFAVVYLINMLDTKIHDRTDVEKANPEIPVVAEIPFIEGGGMFLDPGDRSALAESFRILATNAEYMVGKRKPGKGKVIYVTSTIKGEGKTFVSLNMSLAFASVKKKVLLVGADLRNPQLHTYFDINKSHIKGLSNYLHNPDVSLDDCITEGFGINEYHKICFSGIIPPNAPQLLAGDAFEKFLEEAKAEFDYVIVDLAPTLLVTDTLIVSRFADETVYVTKANHTDKKLLEYSKELNAKGKLRNMAYVVNGVGQSGSGRYGYGYTYNYGYGYGYNTDSEVKTKKNIFQKIFKK